MRVGEVSSVPVRYLAQSTVERRTLRSGDIIIETAGGGRDRPTGRTLMITQELLDRFDLPVTCASFARFLRVDSAKANSGYVFWYLQHLYNMGAMWEHQVQHTGLARFQYTIFARSVPIPLPARSDQNAIAEALGALDDKIELNRQMNRTLEAMAQALFKSWFVDFDPVVAKAAGRQPFGMNADTAALFPSCFVESEGGPTPEGWKVSRIGDEVRVVGGSTPSTGDNAFWANGTIHWITPRDLSKIENPVVVDTERRITQEGLNEISSGLLPVGTVLLSSRAPIGYLALAAIPLAVNQGFIALVCDRSLPSLYVLRWVRESLEEILSRAGGTTFAEISKANFRPISVLVPGEMVLEAFSETATPMYDRITANIRESATLAALRDTLLPKLMSGEIRLRDAEKAVGSAI